MKSHRLDMLYPLRTSPEIHTRANPQYRMDQVGNAADQQFLGRALMWTLLQVCCSLSPIWDSPDRITYEVVSLSIWRAEYRKYCARMTYLGCLHTAEEIFLDLCFYMWSDLGWHGEKDGGSLGPFSWLVYFIHYHPSQLVAGGFKRNWRGAMGIVWELSLIHIWRCRRH